LKQFNKNFPKIEHAGHDWAPLAVQMRSAGKA